MFEGQKIIEIKPKRMNKGSIITEILAKEDWGFVLAIGDDCTDEDMFVALPSEAYIVNVGMRPTNARFQVGSVDEVLSLIDSLK